jgi:hypothetical protein
MESTLSAAFPATTTAVSPAFAKRLTQPEENTLIGNQLPFKTINYTPTKSSVLLKSSIQYFMQLHSNKLV